MLTVAPSTLVHRDIDPSAVRSNRRSRPSVDQTLGAETTPGMPAGTRSCEPHQILIGRLNEALARFGVTFPPYEAPMLLDYRRTARFLSAIWATDSKYTARA